ncbi:hypothetical protein ACLB1M_20895 [Escherichia coli]
MSIEAVTGEGVITTVHATAMAKRRCAHLLKAIAIIWRMKVLDLERTRQFKLRQRRAAAQETRYLPVRRLMLMVLSCWLASFAVLTKNVAYHGSA